MMKTLQIPYNGFTTITEYHHIQFSDTDIKNFTGLLIFRIAEAMDDLYIFKYAEEHPEIANDNHFSYVSDIIDDEKYWSVISIVRDETLNYLHVYHSVSNIEKRELLVRSQISAEFYCMQLQENFHKKHRLNVFNRYPKWTMDIAEIIPDVIESMITDVNNVKETEETEDE